VSEQLQSTLFLERLKKSRERLGLTQRELSGLCDLSEHQIHRYERGLQEPTLTAMRKISEMLGVSIDYLAGTSDDPHGKIVTSDLNIFEREMVDTYRRDGWAGVARLSVERLAK
jgi:transcriptional regulator with XRE-family HTH domain